ncbi:hypothetical protein [Actinomadura harenae]|uniref:hypothetical protein n=1 Tax=Actinomadura harenae TaxID=2483351 RepID=UPI0018F68B00|nr:hypothetical protein [Actinomadura harenae]
MVEGTKDWHQRYAASGRLPGQADGNAVNFLHGASVGAFILLVQAEILAVLTRLTRAEHEPGMHELDAAERDFIAATWLRYFDGTS